MTDIRNGVNAGKTVTVHDTQITLNGWSGTGYTILDPESGAGAYMIGGGLDGGFTTLIGLTYLFLGVMGLMVALSGLILAFATGGASLLVTIAAITASITVIMKGLAILNPKFALNQCKNYAASIWLGTVSIFAGALFGGVLTAVTTSYIGVSTSITSWITNRICGI